MILVRIHSAPEVRADDARRIAMSEGGHTVGCAIWLLLLCTKDAPVTATDNEFSAMTGMDASVIRQAIAVMGAYGIRVDNMTPDAIDMDILRQIKGSPDAVSNQAIELKHLLAKGSAPERCRKLELAGLIAHPPSRARGWVVTDHGSTFSG